MAEAPAHFIPGPIATPLAMAKRGEPQRKDMLRFALENTVSLVGAIAVGDLLDRIEELEDARQEGRLSEFETGLLDSMTSQSSGEALKELQRLGMEQMSLGKWVALLRTLAAFTKKHKIDLVLPEALSVYPSAKKAIDDLVTRRNHDAHGPMIAAEKLEDELDERQKLLDGIVANLVFLKSWTIFQFDRFEINGTDQIFFGTRYESTGSRTFELPNPSAPIPISEPLLLHEDRKRLIRLLPLAIVAPIDGEETTDLSLYSKEIKNDSDQLGFLSLTGSSSVKASDWLTTHGVDLPLRRQSFERIFKSPEISIPRVEASFELARRDLKVGDEPIELVLSVRNLRNSTPLESLTAVARLPRTLRFTESQDDGIRLDEQRVELQWPSMEPNSEVSMRLMVEAVSQGSESLPPATVSFQYRLTDSAETADESGELDAGGHTVQVLDPNSEDALIPIVNLHRHIELTEQADAIHIGDRFEFNVTLHNVGLGRASEVQTYVIVPEGLQILDGPDHVLLNLAPNESRRLRWSLRARRPGIYQIRVCDAVYEDLAGRRHATECSEEHRFLVRSNKQKQFKYAVRDVLNDLQVTDEEDSTVSTMLDGLRDQIPDAVDRDRLRRSAETDAIIEIVRDTVNALAQERGIRIQEQLFTETKWQAKRHEDRGVRNVLSFTYGEIPFFAIDFTDGEQGRIFLNSFDVPGGDRPPFRPLEENLGVFGSNKVVNGTLDTCLAWEDIRNDDQHSLPFLKGWIGRCLNRLARSFKPWECVASRFASALGGRTIYRWQRYEIVVPDQTKNNACLQDIADPSGAYRCCGWVFQDEKRPSRFTLIVNMKSGAPGMSKGGVKWVQREHETGRWNETRFYKSLAKKPGRPEPANRDSYWLGQEVEWTSSDDDETITQAAERLIAIARHSYARDANKTETATFGKGKIEVPMLRRETGSASWLDGRLQELFEAGVGIRMAFTTHAAIRGSLEFFRLAEPLESGCPESSIARLKTAGGDGELWLNWYEGMDPEQPIVQHLELDAANWNTTTQIPDAIRRNCLFRVKAEPVDQPTFDAWINAIIDASKSTIPAWPEFAVETIVDQTLLIEPDLGELLRVLETGPKTLSQIRKLAGERGKNTQLACNRLLNWTKRYQKASPFVASGSITDGIDINPSYRESLLTSIK